MSSEESTLLRLGLERLHITCEPTDRNVGRIRFAASRFVTWIFKDLRTFYRVALKLYPAGSQKHLYRTCFLATALELRFDEVGDTNDLVESASLHQELGRLCQIMGLDPTIRGTDAMLGVLPTSSHAHSELEEPTASIANEVLATPLEPPPELANPSAVPMFIVR